MEFCQTFSQLHILCHVIIKQKLSSIVNINPNSSGNDFLLIVNTTPTLEKKAKMEQYSKYRKRKPHTDSYTRDLHNIVKSGFVNSNFTKGTKYFALDYFLQ